MSGRNSPWWWSLVLGVAAAQSCTAQSVDDAPPRTRPADPVAMLVDVQGEATVEAARGPVPARRMLMLRPGDKLQRAADARLKLIYLADLHYEVLRGTSAVVGQATCEPADAIERIEAPELKRTPALARLRELAPDSSGAAGVIGRARMKEVGPAPPPKVPPVIAPSEDTAVITDRPTFAWPAQGAGAQYRFSLRDVDTGRVVVDQMVRAPKLELAAPQPALVRGHFYQWQVTAQAADGQPVRIRGEFWVVEEPDAASLEQLAPLAASAKPEEVLLAALAYRAHECTDDAIGAFERLLKLSPDDHFVRRSLGELYREVHRLEDAERLRQETNPAAPPRAK